MRLRNQYQKIARKLTDSPTVEDLKAAQEAIYELLAERIKRASHMSRLLKRVSK